MFRAFETAIFPAMFDNPLRHRGSNTGKRLQFFLCCSVHVDTRLRLSCFISGSLRISVRARHMLVSSAGYESCQHCEKQDQGNQGEFQEYLCEQADKTQHLKFELLRDKADAIVVCKMLKVPCVHNFVTSQGPFSTNFSTTTVERNGDEK